MAIRLRLSRFEETTTGPAARRALLTVAVGLLAWWSPGGVRGAQAQTVPPPAPAMTGEARAHYDRGLALYAAKDYGAAIQELEAGYALDPRREFLFAEAQAQRLAGDCQRAVPLYQRFLTSEPSPLQASAAQVGLARCAQQMATATATNPPRRSRPGRRR
jgi:tetratricopeptide (TPR) repeat protein